MQRQGVSDVGWMKTLGLSFPTCAVMVIISIFLITGVFSRSKKSNSTLDFRALVLGNKKTWLQTSILCDGSASNKFVPCTPGWQHLSVWSSLEIKIYILDKGQMCFLMSFLLPIFDPRSDGLSRGWGCMLKGTGYILGLGKGAMPSHCIKNQGYKKLNLG